MVGKGKIKVLIVDDSMFFRASIVKGLSTVTDIEIVGEAYDPYDARDKILELEPDVMTLDIEMPYMNGVEFLKVLLPQWPIPVVVVSSSLTSETDARKAGAYDFLPKPTDRSPESLQLFIQDLIRRVRSAARESSHGYRSVPANFVLQDSVSSGNNKFTGYIALGASTGGTQSTGKILKALPADVPGMVVVQHMPPDFTRMYAENLDKDCAMTIKEAKDGDQIEKGVVLIAPGGNMHLEVVKRGTGYCVHLFHGEKVNGHCPSVDVLFNSVAKTTPGKDAIGIILTGMGADGARGLLEIKNKGGYTIGQDEKSSIVYGMPREAYEIGAVVRQVSLENIASVLMGYVRDLRR